MESKKECKKREKRCGEKKRKKRQKDGMLSGALRKQQLAQSKKTIRRTEQ
jgi:hypothetical protein